MKFKAMKSFSFLAFLLIVTGAVSQAADPVVTVQLDQMSELNTKFVEGSYRFLNPKFLVSGKGVVSMGGTASPSKPVYVVLPETQSVQSASCQQLLQIGYAVDLKMEITGVASVTRYPYDSAVSYVQFSDLYACRVKK